LKNKKPLRSLFLILLLLAVALVSMNPVKAQGTATVNVLVSLGGSTTPSGTSTYADGTVVTLNATPGSAYTFAYWEISSSSGVNLTTDNPTTFMVSDSLTYTVQPVFQPINEPVFVPAVPSAPTSSIAVVIVLASVGGTTSPGAGTYELSNATSLTLTATPLSGWVFDNWVIGGYPLSHGGYSFTDTPTNNPYNVNHGYGYTYSYQPVFSLVSSSTSTPTTVPTTPEFPSAGIIGVVAILIVVLLGSGIYEYRKRQ
jgi:hypothetical protein